MIKLEKYNIINVYITRVMNIKQKPDRTERKDVQLKLEISVSHSQ